MGDRMGDLTGDPTGDSTGDAWKTQRETSQENRQEIPREISEATGWEITRVTETSRTRRVMRDPNKWAHPEPDQAKKPQLTNPTIQAEEGGSRAHSPSSHTPTMEVKPEGQGCGSSTEDHHLNLEKTS